MYVNGGSVIAIGIIFPILGIMVTTGRFMARSQRKIGFKIDDWLCIPALMLVIVCGALLVWGSVERSIGHHSPIGQTLEMALFDNSRQMMLTLKIEWFVLTFSTVGTGLIRLAILFFYRRIFRGRSFNLISWTLIVIMSLWTLAFTVGFLSMCGTNLPAIWGTAAQIHTECFETLKFDGIQGITAFVLDLVLLSLPFFYIWRLNMKTSQKWGASSVFLVGLFTVGAGAARMVVGIQVMEYVWGSPANILGLEMTNDLVGGISVFLFWIYVEFGTGMIVCCLPSLKGLNLSKMYLTLTVPSLPSLSFLAARKRSTKSADSIDTSSLEDHASKQRIIVTNSVEQYTV